MNKGLEKEQVCLKNKNAKRSADVHTVDAFWLSYSPYVCAIYESLPLTRNSHLNEGFHSTACKSNDIAWKQNVYIGKATELDMLESLKSLLSRIGL